MLEKMDQHEAWGWLWNLCADTPEDTIVVSRKSIMVLLSQFFHLEREVNNPGRIQVIGHIETFLTDAYLKARDSLSEVEFSVMKYHMDLMLNKLKEDQNIYEKLYRNSSDT